jgi:hypothetical protein
MGLYDVGDLLEKSLQNKLQVRAKGSGQWMLVICSICSAIAVVLFGGVWLFFGGDSGYAIAGGVFMVALVLSLSAHLNAKSSVSVKDEKTE